MIPQDINAAAELVETAVLPCASSRSHHDHLRTVERINHWVYGAYMAIGDIHVLNDPASKALAHDVATDNLVTAAIYAVLAVQHFTEDSEETLKRLEAKLQDIIRQFS